MCNVLPFFSIKKKLPSFKKTKYKPDITLVIVKLLKYLCTNTNTAYLCFANRICINFPLLHTVHNSKGAAI